MGRSCRASDVATHTRALTADSVPRGLSCHFNKRKKEDARKTEADKEAAGRRATEAQILEDAERLVAVECAQAKRAPMLFAPTIGAAIAARHWWLWVRCPACRATNAIDLRTLDRHPDAAITSLIPALSCRSCRPNAPFAEFVQLSRLSVTDEWNVERGRAVLGEVGTCRRDPMQPYSKWPAAAPFGAVVQAGGDQAIVRGRCIILDQFLLIACSKSRT